MANVFHIDGKLTLAQVVERHVSGVTVDLQLLLVFLEALFGIVAKTCT